MPKPTHLTGCAYLLLLAALPFSRPLWSQAPLVDHRQDLIRTYQRGFRGFEINRGQTHPLVQFLLRGDRYTLFLARNEAVLVGKTAVAQVQPQALRIRWPGANHLPSVMGEDALPTTVSYFTGNQPKRWPTGIPTYANVRYRNLYPGIDMIYHGGAGELEYDFVLRPRADSRRIRFRFDGASRMELSSSGDLLLHTAAGVVQQRKPAAYQEVGGVRRPVATHYAVYGQLQAGLEAGPYDHRLPLIIDPVLVYSSYLGGSDSGAGLSVAVDAQGNAYVAGVTAAADFPVKNGLQPVTHGDRDVFVTKVNPTGSGLVYSTYLGGSSMDVAYGVAVDSQGQAYVTGATWSSDFPTANPLQRMPGGNSDAFLSVIGADGSTLVFSTYLGGSGADVAYAITLDNQGHATIVGSTESLDFPTSRAFQGAHGGGVRDGFVSQFQTAGTSLVFSTYLGGSGGDECRGVVTDVAGNIFVTGATWSNDFPVKNAVQAAHAGDNLFSDAFVTEFSPAGAGLVYSTYLGGSGQDIGNAIVVDAKDQAWVAGETTSADLPVTAGSFQSSLGALGSEDGFLAGLGAGGTRLALLTYFGGSQDDFATTLATDAFGNILVAGGTASTNFPGVSSVSPDTGLGDAFLMSFQPSGSLNYTVLLAGSGSDLAMGVAADDSGNSFVTGLTDSPNFPVPGGFQPATQGDGDGFIAQVSGSASLGALNTVSAASFTAPVAAASIGSSFGANLSSGTFIAGTVQVPISLGGARLRITDSASAQQFAPLFAVTPSRVDFLVPSGTASGLAQVTLIRPDGSTVSGQVLITGVAPALFSANSSGNGVAAAIATTVTGSAQTAALVFTEAPVGSRTAVPIDLGGSNTQVNLALFGTGIRGYTTSGIYTNPNNVTVSVGSQNVPVLYAGPQGSYAGVDQVIVLLPQSLAGRGAVNITLTIAGRTSNAVMVNIR